MNPESEISYDHWQRIQALFAAVVDLPLEAMIERLNGLENDAETKAIVLGMLRADAAGREAEPKSTAFKMLNQVLLADEIGLQCGAFRITKLLGQGGMGKVFLAERIDQSVRQLVAIKLLPAHQDSLELLRRFESERRILARLQHTNIARFLDAGASEPTSAHAARPYIAMEWIDGEPITTYCERKTLNLRQRLELFLQVLEGVAYAHRQLVVHRDIKPGNVLVDASGVAKLLDFGIAKPLEDLDEHLRSSDRTSTQMRSFSARYAAPEQMRGEPVGVACDIYALGNLLHELLTGQTALSFEGLSFAQTMEKLANTIPPDPSSRVHANGWLAAKEIRGDLDRITLHALKKLPSERYLSVEAMAYDVRCVLNNEPISLRRDMINYRAYKFVQRNKLPVALASLLFAGLVSTSIVLWQQQRALLVQRDKALLAQQKAQDVTHFLLDAFHAADPSQNRGEKLSAREVLDQAAISLTRRALDDQSKAELMQTILQVYSSLGLFKQSKVLWQPALNLSNTMSNSVARVALLQELANAQGSAGEPKARAESVQSARAAMFSLGEELPALEVEQLLLDSALAREEGQLQPSIELAKLAYQHTLNNASVTTLLPKAVSAYAARMTGEDAIRLIETHLAQVIELDTSVGIALQLRLARMYYVQERYADAMAASKATQALIAKYYGTNVGLELQIIRLDALLAEARGDTKTGIAETLRGIELARTHFQGENNPMVFTFLINLSNMYFQLADYQSAESNASRALKIGESIWPSTESNLDYAMDIYARALYAVGKYEPAVAMAERCMISAARFSTDPAPGPLRIGALSVLIQNDLRLGRREQAITNLKLVAPRLDIAGLDPKVHATLASLAALHLTDAPSIQR
jgi:eukaryotic-like serine/threonine-protein kinase